MIFSGEEDVEADMVEQGLELEIYTNIGDETEDQAVTQLLETLDIDALIRRTLQQVSIKQAVMLTLLICGDAEIQALNKQHRQQDKPTDVLSFPLLDEPLVEAPAAWLWQPPEEEQVCCSKQPFVTPGELLTNLGDIVISWPTVQRQAREAGHSVGYELLFLLCHGVLHLVGYDDQTETGYQEMLRLQQTLLSFHFISISSNGSKGYLSQNAPTIHQDTDENRNGQGFVQ